jgi:hypothetical protein
LSIGSNLPDIAPFLKLSWVSKKKCVVTLDKQAIQAITLSKARPENLAEERPKKGLTFDQVR